MKSHYTIVILKLPVVTSACTIDSNPGYGTPISCTDQIGSQTTEIRDYRFTNWEGPIDGDNPTYNNILNISETATELKTGNGLATRSTLNVTLSDFTGDPNEDSPAVLADPSIINQGTFIGKLDERQIIKNKEVERQFWEFDHSTQTSTLLKSNFYYGQYIKKRKSRDEWELTCKDLLERSSDKKSKFPEEINESLINAITAGSGTLTITNDAGLDPQDWIDAGVCVVGKDIMKISNAVIGGGGIQLTVSRDSSIVVGSTNVNTYSNTPVAAEEGENVFKGQIYEDSLIADVITDHFDVAGITEYNATEIQDEIAAWISNPTLSTIFFESKGVNDSLNNICEKFVLDIFPDVQDNEVKVLANSPWKSPVRALVESLDFDYNKTAFEYRSELRVSNAVLRYYKKNLSESDNEREYLLAAQDQDTTLDGDDFYGDSPTKKFEETTIFGDSLQDSENAQLTVSRHVDRFAVRPLSMVLSMSEEQLGDLVVGDVVTVSSEFKQGFDGNPLPVRAQITRVSLKDKISRRYEVKLLNYDPEVGEGAITVVDNSDINLFLIAGAPPSGEYTFLFDGNNVGTGASHAIRTGNFVAGSIVNIVGLNGADYQARAGSGGAGGDVETFEPVYGDGSPGGDGQVVIICDASITVNIYLSGNHTVQGENYTADATLLAPGGGGGGGAGFAGSTGSGGGGGAGRPGGTGGSAGNWIGPSPVLGEDGSNGNASNGGQGGQLGNIGGDGGDHGEVGDDGTPGSTGGDGGQAGSAIDINSATVNVYGATIGVNYIQGNGDTPNFIP